MNNVFDETYGRYAPAVDRFQGSLRATAGRPEALAALPVRMRQILLLQAEGSHTVRWPRSLRALTSNASSFKTVALPYYAVVTPDAAPVVTFPGLTRKPEQFVAFLQAGLGKLARGPDASE